MHLDEELNGVLVVVGARTHLERELASVLSGASASAPAIDKRFQSERWRDTGVLSRGVQVARTAGSSEKPDSS